MSGRAEAHLLRHHRGIRTHGVIAGNQAGNIHQHGWSGARAGKRVNRHEITPSYNMMARDGAGEGVECYREEIEYAVLCSRAASLSVGGRADISRAVPDSVSAGTIPARPVSPGAVSSRPVSAGP